MRGGEFDRHRCSVCCARAGKDIERDDVVPSAGERFDLAPAALVALLGLSLLLYLSRAVLPVL